MKNIKMFVMTGCAHCVLAERFLSDLQKQDKYKDIEIERINETEEPKLANRYDYYYVPTFYVGDEKVHEGHAEREDVQKVLDLVLED